MKKQAPMSFAARSGFSLIELVVVILLVGIVSVVVVARFMGSAEVDATGMRNGLIAGLRSAQQAALGRVDVSLTVAAVGDRWVIAAKQGAATIRELVLPNRTVVLETGSALSSDFAPGENCESGSSFDTALANDFAVTFDNLGNLKSFTNNSVVQLVSTSPDFNGVRICVNDSDVLSVCVSPAGYAYAGRCDD